MSCSISSPCSIDWQQAIAASPVGMVIADAQASDFPAIYVNPAFERTTGYCAAEVIGKNFRFLQGNDFDQPEIEQIRQALANQKPCTVTLRNYRKDGTLFWNELTISPIFDAAGQMVQVVGIQNDVSDRKQAEAERQQQEALYRSIFEFAIDGISIMDLETGKAVAANPALCEMHGYSYEEFIQLDPKSIIHSDSRALFQKFLANLKSGESFQANAIDIRKDGTPFEIEVRGSVCWVNGHPYALSIIRDISERVQLETERQRLEEERQQALTALRRNHALLRAKQEASLDGILIVNEHAQVLFYNQRLLQVWELPESLVQDGDEREVLAQVATRLQDSAMLINQVECLDQQPTLKRRGELSLLDGRTIDGYTTAIFSPEGEYYGRVWYFRDISDRKETEAKLRYQAEFLKQTLEELQQAQTQLVQSEKMSSLGQLVAGVAHEINNPVSFIYSNLSPAQNYIEDLLGLIECYQHHYPQPVSAVQDLIESVDLDFVTADLPKLLNSMYTGAERIREIVLSLRTFSRLDEAEFKPADIHAGLESTLMILQHRLRAVDQRPAIAVVKQYDALPWVECYAGQLNQVLMNLLANAIDALEDAFKAGQSELKILVTTEKCDRTVKIRIADTGTGMSAETAARIFDPFFTTKPIGVGTGMGLAISYQIVTERHQGSLSCQSELGQGTEFVIEIPLTQSTALLS